MEKLERMVREIAAEVAATVPMTGRKTLDPRLIDALRAVPRHEFVPVGMLPFAYENEALPIGQGQTISQPYIVALMTELLQLGPKDRVLEIGTGTGYQTAILARLAQRVYSVELIPQLLQDAAQRLERLGCRNVELRRGDGYRGWPEHAPYEAIIVTAAAEEIPPALLEQLAPGGRMVIPVNRGQLQQELALVRKEPTGKVTTTHILPVSFVPLTHAGTGHAPLPPGKVAGGSA